MGDKQRILLAFGTRPEAIKMFPVVVALRASEAFDVRVCVSAQHRGMLDQVLAITGIVPDHDLDIMRPGQSLDALTAALLTGFGELIDREAPARVMVQGDTATAAAAALAAYYRRVPVDHVEAGLRSDNIYHPWPEEVNRKIVAAIADLHFAPTETAAAALRRENVDAARVFTTGNTVIDALRWMDARSEAEPGLSAAMVELEHRYRGKRIIGITTHRRENFGEGMRNIARAIAAIARRDDVAVVFPVHLNPAVRTAMRGELECLDNVALVEPFDYPNFVRLLRAADVMLTDSGGVQEEAPAFGTPVLVMRETTERPEGLEAGTARLVGTEASRIVAEVTRLLDDADAHRAMARAHNPFGDGHAAARIARILADRAR